LFFQCQLGHRRLQPAVLLLELGTDSAMDPFSEESPFEFGNEA
jgi:hypothetical protein